MIYIVESCRSAEPWARIRSQWMCIDIIDGFEDDKNKQLLQVSAIHQIIISDVTYRRAGSEEGVPKPNVPLLSGHYYSDVNRRK